MKTLSKHTLFVTAIALFTFSMLFLQDNAVEGKGKVLPAVTPFAGAKMVLTKTSDSRTAGQPLLTTTSGIDGSFTFPAIEHADRPSMTTYTLTVIPPMTYTVTDSKSSGPKATPVRTPVTVSITFNQLRGMSCGGGSANSAPLGPLVFSSSDSLNLKVPMGGIISGTVTK
jgi:hypothetical protein